MDDQKNTGIIQREAADAFVSMSYLHFFVGWPIDGDSIFIFGFIASLPYLGRHSYREAEQLLSCDFLLRPGQTNGPKN